MPIEISFSSVGSGTVLLLVLIDQQLEGGGKAALLIWIILAWLLLEFVGYNLVTLLCHILIIIMLIIYIFLTGVKILRWAPEPIRTTVQDFIGELILVLGFLAIFNPILYFIIILFLWQVSLIGNYISSLHLILFGTVSMATLRYLYKRYEKEVADLVDKINQKTMDIFKKFESMFLQRPQRDRENEESKDQSELM